jgi:hypothetical protein
MPGWNRKLTVMLSRRSPSAMRGLMSRGAHKFKQGDVTKAVKAMVNAGVNVGRVEIADGKIIVIAAKPEQDQGIDSVNEWDAVK